jgi:peptide-methionine (S)-S-oxide reductase
MSEPRLSAFTAAARRETMDQTCDIPRVKTHQFPDPVLDTAPAAGEKTAVLAGGCFWCVEAVIKELDGVLGVRSGYAGGTAATANYEAVCSGMTDHAEVIEVRYDPSRVSYGQLLKVFFSVAHDPTQVNRQGADQGRQYRSAIFPADEEQKRVAEAYIRQLDESGILGAKIATTVEPLETFYEAEAYHQDYAARNPRQPYVAFTATPKVEKLRTYYPDRLKR